jgi:hypothetical protein
MRFLPRHAAASPPLRGQSDLPGTSTSGSALYRCHHRLVNGCDIPACASAPGGGSVRATASSSTTRRRPPPRLGPAWRRARSTRMSRMARAAVKQLGRVTTDPSASPATPVVPPGRREGNSAQDTLLKYQRRIPMTLYCLDHEHDWCAIPLHEDAQICARCGEIRQPEIANSSPPKRRTISTA